MCPVFATGPSLAHFGRQSDATLNGTAQAQRWFCLVFRYAREKVLASVADSKVDPLWQRHGKKGCRVRRIDAIWSIHVTWRRRCVRENLRGGNPPADS